MEEKKTMRKSSPVWALAIIIVFVLLILNLVFVIKKIEIKEELDSFGDRLEINFTRKIGLKTECPGYSGGNKDSYLRIKYFYSDFCVWCQREEPILQKVVQEHGSLFYIEWFDVNSCSEDVEKYKIGGVPTFIFGTSDDKSEYSHYGFIYEKDLKKLICDVTGGC